MAFLALAIVIGLAVWCAGLRGQPHQPPSRDGLYRGFVVERIVDTGSMDPARVVVTDPVTETPAAGFQPPAFPTTVALMRSLAGVPIGVLLTVTTVLAAAVLLPAGPSRSYGVCSCAVPSSAGSRRWPCHCSRCSPTSPSTGVASV